MDSFNNFVQKKSIGKLYIETDDTEFSEEWKMTLDITKLYNEYATQKISLLDFNNEYATLLTNNSENITKSAGEEAWQSIEPIAINELKEATNEKESEPIYNKLYDIFDQFEINIKCDETNNQQPLEIEPGQSIQVQTTQPVQTNKPVQNSPENKIKVQ